jgi:hypothetical protein
MKFNRIFGNILLVYNLAQESVIPFPVRILFKIIVLNRHKEVLSGISMKIEEITDLRSLLVIRRHDMRTEVFRKECVGCKIDERVSRGAR